MANYLAKKTQTEKRSFFYWSTGTQGTRVQSFKMYLHQTAWTFGSYFEFSLNQCVFVLLVSSHFLPYVICDVIYYAIPPYPSSHFRYSRFSYDWQLLHWHVPYFRLPFQVPHVPTCFKWVNSHFCSRCCIARRAWASSYLLSCCHLYCFQLFYELRVAFPLFPCILYLRFNDFGQNIYCWYVLLFPSVYMRVC